MRSCSNKLFALVAVGYAVILGAIRFMEVKNAEYLREEIQYLAHRNHREKLGADVISEETVSDRRIIVAGLARNIQEITETVWKSFRSYCQNLNASIHIQTRERYDDSGTAEYELRDCFEVVITFDARATRGVIGVPEWSWENLYTWGPFRALSERVGKITKAREGQLADIRKYIRKHSLQSVLEAIVIVDMDMASLPDVRSLENAVEVVGPAGKWDAICADGVDSLEIYYDTFATIVSFETFYDLPVLPLFRPLLHDAYGYTYFFSTPSWLMKRLQAVLKTDPRSIIPVRSCFGGMTVYRAKQLIDNCSYAWRGTETDKYRMTGFSRKGDIVCEHVRMHLCLENANKARGRDFKIGISKHLGSRWGSMLAAK